MSQLSNKLLPWYYRNKRDLPWRNTKNPYLIWVSEIILQQTRVEQGFDYYLRFIDAFPDIKALATSEIDQVLKIWQGLGYYSRARNMHLTANYIYKELNGEFPKSFIELKKLKGIGDYTAAAIASFAFNEIISAVDGNVYRVLSRVYGIFESTQTSSGKKVFFDKAQDVIDRIKPADFNQAIMEFGAIQCTPKKPDCNSCVFNQSCYAFLNNAIDDLPLKKQSIKKRNRYFYYIHIIYKDYIFLQKRHDKDIWALLYQMPLLEFNSEINLEKITNHSSWKKIFNQTTLKVISISDKIKHILSHQNIHTRFIKVEIKQTNHFIDDNYLKIKFDDVKNYSTPRLIESYLNRNLK